MRDIDIQLSEKFSTGQFQTGRIALSPFYFGPGERCRTAIVCSHHYIPRHIQGSGRNFIPAFGNAGKSQKGEDEKIEEVSRLVQEELSKKHKVILVSQFIDTVSYYYDELYTRLNDENNPVRMGMVTGGANNGANSGNKINQISRVSKKEVLDRFSPQSKNRMDLFNTD